MVPKKDIVGLFKQAAQKQGLKFAVSEHLAFSYVWWTVSHGSDKTGPLAGVPYDGADPQYAELYHDYPKEFLVPEQNNQPTRLPAPLAWRQHYFDRLKDLIDKYEPDLLYNDGGMVFPEVHYQLVSHLYNVSAKLHGGKVEAVYTSKGRKDSQIGTCVYDIERGVADQIQPNPWQTDTCIGDWHYRRGVRYKTPKQVIDMLCDIVSRNGNLMLNFPLPNNGELDAQELNVLDGITRWMAVNSEGIYASRPWKIFGDGPGTKPAAAADLRFNESARKDLSAEDVRFTTKGRDLYAFVMGWPERQTVIKPLAANGQYVTGKIAGVQLLGFPGKLKWTQDTDGLKVELPPEKPCDYAFTLKIAGLG
jgi:alpha-L-fucosidase